MRRFILVAVAPLAALLLGADPLVEEQPRNTEVVRSEDQEALRGYNHQLEDVLDAQVEELIRLSPAEDHEEIRQSYYDWKLTRDSSCPAAPSPDLKGQSERECRSYMAEDRYEAIEIKIAEAEERRSSK